MRKKALGMIGVTTAFVLSVFGANCVLAEEATDIVEESADTDTYDATDFLDWFRTEDRYKSVGAVSKEEGAVTGYIQDESGKPTEEDMADILDFTSKAVASGGENDVFFVVVEDVDMQETIIGTSKGNYVSEGTVTVLVYSERLVAEENQVSEDGTVYKYQVDRGYYDAGIATGYFNIAATAYGYGTHMFQGTALSGGSVGERSVNYDQFLKDEDGNWLIYRNGDTTSETWYGDHPAENLKFVCAIVVGTMDTTLDIDGFTGATVRSEYPANYAYWSGYTETVEEDENETTDADSSATAAVSEDTEATDAVDAESSATVESENETTVLEDGTTDETSEEVSVAQETIDSLTSIVDMLVNDRTNWNFTDEAVSEEDLTTILTAGINTSSAVNEQPWVFSVITDQELLEELGVTSLAPVAIMISVDNSNEMKIVDAGLACQTMYITAKALGYGAKVESTAARVVRNDETGEYMERLGIPDTMSARALLLIGCADEEADAVSTASERKDFDEVVVFAE